MTDTASDPVDDLLVMQAQDGDRRSMEDLVRRWQKRLWTHAYRLTASSDAAWDITQQAWMGIIKGLNRLHDPASFRSWAYRIVTNKVMDHLKSRAQATAVSDGPEHGAPRQEDRVILRDLLSRLQPEKQAILVLYYLEGLTVPELAFVLGVPQGTVKSRLHASRAELRKLWQQAAAETGDERRRHQEDR